MEVIAFFILLYILQLIFGKKKKPQQQRQRHQPAETADYEDNQPSDWDEAMKELEGIFTGEYERQQPDPEPVYESPKRPEPKPEPTAVSSSNRELERQKEYAAYSGSAKDALTTGLDEDNPIVKHTDEEVQRGDAMRSQYPFLKRVRKNKVMAEALIMKEVFDRPKALRRDKRIF